MNHIFPLVSIFVNTNYVFHKHYTYSQNDLRFDKIEFEVIYVIIIISKRYVINLFPNKRRCNKNLIKSV